jgi:hypothetical protein
VRSIVPGNSVKGMLLVKQRAEAVANGTTPAAVTSPAEPPRKRPVMPLFIGLGAFAVVVAVGIATGVFQP